MSRFCEDYLNRIEPYIPGEQPKDMKYVKLNTNENPYSASKYAVEGISVELLQNLNRYSDPESSALRRAIAAFYGVDESNVLVTNGSDEALAFAFIAYCKNGVCYPDVTYGFYDVIANLFGCAVEHINLKDDFTICAKDYYNKEKAVVIANPNAQTGIAMSREELISIIENNTDNVVVVDQAYADFSDYNAIDLVKKYKNLITVNTFSKSRSLAGARVGYVIADSELIEDLKKVKNSFHPYNVNSVSALLAARAMEDREYFEFTVGKIKETRKRLTESLKGLGFEVLPSSANFVLARCDRLDGMSLYLRLKGRGVLIRHLSDERIADYIRITVGSDGEVDALLSAIEEIFAEL